MTPVETRARISAMRNGKPRSEAIGRAASGVGAMAMPAAPLTINVRHFHKGGLLRDETAFFALKWVTDEGLAATAEREEVNLFYLRGDEEVVQRPVEALRGLPRALERNVEHVEVPAAGTVRRCPATARASDRTRPGAARPTTSRGRR